MRKIVLSLVVTLLSVAAITGTFIIKEANQNRVSPTSRARFYYGRLKEYVELRLVLLHHEPRAPAPLKIMGLIAHAGGGVEGQSYTESLDALDSNYRKGFRYFEMDVEWTSDNQLVLLHDWQRLPVDYETTKHAPITREEFIKLESRHKLQQITMKDLLGWMRRHHDAYVIIDTKANDRTVAMWKKIKILGSDLQPRLIPQIFTFSEYRAAQALGYRSLILALHYKEYSDNGVIEFAKQRPLTGVSMVPYHVENGLANKLNGAETAAFTHTINDERTYLNLRKKGVDSVFTDWLDPAEYRH